MGCIGGAVFTAIKGFKLAPPVCCFKIFVPKNLLMINEYHILLRHTFLLQGIKSRLHGLVTSVKVKAPVLGGICFKIIKLYYRIVIYRGYI